MDLNAPEEPGNETFFEKTRTPLPGDNGPVIVVGAGPAGLCAAHRLVQQGVRPLLFEKTDKIGGIARTETYRGFHFDIGGHRFFTKMQRINALWEELMQDEFLKVVRKSSIYYQGRFFHYPLSFSDTLRNLGFVESILIILSYLWAQFRQQKDEATFEQWISNRFGRRLFSTFFKTYTEKVWGMPCQDISADWAAQRIKGLSLVTTLANTLFGVKKSKTLIDEFKYPRFGPGMMWQRFLDCIESQGGVLHLECETVCLHHYDNLVKSLIIRENGKPREIAVGHLLSTMPISQLVNRFKPEAPMEVRQAARNLRYRSLIIVGIIIDESQFFADQWIYVHDPEVRVARIQNFKNWSAAMAPDPQMTNLAMEYFCAENDSLWMTSDEELISLATTELGTLGFPHSERIVDAFVIRQGKAYPVYDKGYRQNLAVIREYLKGFSNLQTIGRNGMYRYNNMDHSMLTGILGAENILGARHDLWEVNEEEEYLEESTTSIPQQILVQTFGRLDKLALATAVGSVAGLTFFLATVWLLIKGGDVIGPHLQVLSQYFVGYTVTLEGAFVALAYGFGWGFLFGWLIAYLRNLMVGLYLYNIRRASKLRTLRDFLDYL